MIHGIGADVVAIARVRRAMERHGDRFARKVLADAEWAQLGTRSNQAAFVAKRFAAKEAFFKAFGQPPDAANTWHQLAVLNRSDGRPQLEFGAALARLMQQVGVARWHVSLSDEKEYAVAFIVLESGAA